MDSINIVAIVRTILGPIGLIIIPFILFKSVINSKKVYLQGLILAFLCVIIILSFSEVISMYFTFAYFFILIFWVFKLNIVQSVLGAFFTFIIGFFADSFSGLITISIFNISLEAIANADRANVDAILFLHLLFIVFLIIFSYFGEKLVSKGIEHFRVLKKYQIGMSLLIVSSLLFSFTFLVVYPAFANNFMDYYIFHIGFLMLLLCFFIYFTYISYQHLVQANNAKKMRTELEIDFLTKVYHRGPGLHYAQQQLDLCKSRKLPITFGFIDLDNLKPINDNFGHGAGDAYIRALSQSLLENMRGIDIAIRHGGDEFIFVLPGASKAKALDLEKKVHESLEKESKELSYDMTFSIGIYEKQPDEELSLEKIIKIIDHKMYIDKKVKKSQLKERNVTIDREARLTENL